MWKDEASDAIAAWEKGFKVKAVPLADEASNYLKPPKKGELAIISEVAFRLLCANVPVSRKAEDLQRNGTSAVVAVDFAGVTAILPGDATADTIGWINNEVFDLWKGKPNPVQPCRALGAPHHGALRTIASNFVSGKKARLDFAERFAENIAAQNVVASAGYYTKFKHPYRSVMELLAKESIKGDDHDWVWWDGDIAKWARVTDDKRGIYTTITTLTSPPERVGWRFTITAKGEIFFTLDWEHAEVVEPYERYPAVPRIF